MTKRPCFATSILLTALSLFCQTYAGINISKPITRAIFQRDIYDMATVPVEGTITGITFTSIEARYVLADDPAQHGQWQPMNVVSLDYDGPLDVPAGGWYTIEVRALNNVTTCGCLTASSFVVNEIPFCCIQVFRAVKAGTISAPTNFLSGPTTIICSI